MKKPSDTSTSSEPLEPASSKIQHHVFFTDRDLGKAFAQTLRTNGLLVKPYHEVFPLRPRVEDDEWLPIVGANGWVSVTRDRHVRSRSREADALMKSGARVFVIRCPPPHSEIARVFVAAIPRVFAFLEKHPAPFIANIYKSAEVRMWLTEAKWLKEFNRRAARGGRAT